MEKAEVKEKERLKEEARKVIVSFDVLFDRYYRVRLCLAKTTRIEFSTITTNEIRFINRTNQMG
jgi:hypothetical protein